MYAKDTSGVIDNENIRPDLMQSGDSVYFFDDTEAFIMVDTVFGFYAPVGYTLQVVGLKYTELKAVETTYDNTASGLDAENVQEAIDELEVQVIENKDNVLLSTNNRDVNFVYGINLFNPNTALVDTLLNSSGGLSASTGWSTSDFIDVGSNKSVFIVEPRFVAEYDVFKNLIPDTFVDNSSYENKLFVTNAKTRYIRFTRQTSTMGTSMVMLGTSATTRRYLFSGKAILKQKDGSELYVDNVVNSRYEIKSGGKNLFDKK